MEEQDKFDERIIQISRVSKKTKGGNRIGFSVIAVVGDKNGHVGVGKGHARDVQGSIKKAVTYAKKHMITVPRRGSTIPHDILVKRGAAKILLKPAREGSGIRAGGAVRAVVDAAGIHDITGKRLGTKNKASNVYATLAALEQLREE